MNSINTIFAHKEREGKGRNQLLREHLNNVTNFLRGEGVSIDSQYVALLHDIGKVSEVFQKRLDGKNVRFRHALASLPIADYCLQVFYGKECPSGEDRDIKIKRALAVIYYHHSPPKLSMLENDLIRSYNRDFPEANLTDEEVRIAFEILKDVLQSTYPQKAENLNVSAFFSVKQDRYGGSFVQWLHSILKDIFKYAEEYFDANEKEEYSRIYSHLIMADWYDSSGNAINSPKNYWEDMKQALEHALEKKQSLQHQDQTIVVKKEVLNRTRQSKSDKIFLIAPTGSGKTEASLLWALEKAREGNRSKIIYVLPFKSLLEDLRERLVSYFGDDLVDVWHSDFLFSESEKLMNLKNISSLEDFNFYVSLRKYFLNQESRIILTTADQVLSTFLNTKRYPIRRAIFTDSVFIFDEVQGYGDFMMLLLFLFMKQVLKRNPYAITTATPPAAYKQVLGSELDEIFEETWFDNIREHTNATVTFTRVKKKSEMEGMILNKVQNYVQSNSGKKVCIMVNTVNSAINLAKKLKEKIKSGDYQLILLHSRLLPEEKKNALKKIREDNNPVIVVSTQVIEAGVDVSFDYMIRQMAPIQSIVQAVGRVNRFSKSHNAKVDILLFDLESLLESKNNSEREAARLWSLPYGKEILQHSYSLLGPFNGMSLDKRQLEKIAKEALHNISVPEEEIEYASYISNVASRIFWSFDSPEDLLGENLRENIPQKTIFIRDGNESYKQLVEKRKLLKKELEEKFDREKFEEYLSTLIKLSNRIITLLYFDKVEGEEIDYKDYKNRFSPIS